MMQENVLTSFTLHDSVIAMYTAHEQ